MKWTYIISGFIFLCATIISGLWIQSGPIAGIFAVVGFVLLFLGNLDKFTEFKAGFQGIYAKTRDIVQKAEITIVELQSLAITVTKVTLSLVKRSGRLGGYDDAEEEEIKNNMQSYLEEIKIPEDRYREAFKDWHQLTKYDYVLAILGNSYVPLGFEGHNIIGEWNALRSLEDIPSPDKLREFLAKWNLLTADREEWIKDYEYYINNEKHRSLEIWKKRDSLEPLRKN